MYLMQGRADKPRYPSNVGSVNSFDSFNSENVPVVKNCSAEHFLNGKFSIRDRNFHLRGIYITKSKDQIKPS